MGGMLMKELINIGFPFECLDAKGAALFAKYFQDLADSLRSLAEDNQPSSARRLNSELVAKNIRESAWAVLRLEIDGLNLEDAILLISQQNGVPLWLLKSAVNDNRLGYLNKYRPERNIKINQMLDSGVTTEDVATYFNLSQATVVRVRQKYLDGKEWNDISELSGKIPRVGGAGNAHEPGLTFMQENVRMTHKRRLETALEPGEVPDAVHKKLFPEKIRKFS
jgi:hypothetical protein